MRRRRKLEIVCDFSTRRETRYTHWSWALAEDFTLGDVTRLMGVATREFRETVEVKMMVKVRAIGGDERPVRSEVEGIHEEWTEEGEEFIFVEVVREELNE